MEQLCQEFRIITMDPRGSGDSDPVTRPYELNQHVMDVLAVIEASGAAPVTCVGVSRAASLMIQLAHSHAQLLENMMLVSPAMPIPKFDGFVPASSLHPETDQAIREGNIPRAVELFAPTVISEPGTDELRLQVTQWLLNLPEDTILSFFQDRTGDSEVHNHLRQLAVPTLVMHGTEDKRVPFANGRYVAEQIPNARFYAFEGRGHLPMTTAIGEFCQVLRHFMLTGEAPPREIMGNTEDV